jgi:hypothetical protein
MKAGTRAKGVGLQGKMLQDARGPTRARCRMPMPFSRNLRQRLYDRLKNHLVIVVEVGGGSFE